MLRIIASLAVSVVLSCCCVVLHAQPLAEVAPGDTLIYVGWAGVSSPELRDDYAQSHLKAVIELSSLGEMIETGLDAARQQMDVTEPAMRGVFDRLIELGAATWRYESALCFRGVDFDRREPMPRMVMMWRAGDEAQAVEAAAQHLVDAVRQQAPRGAAPLRVVRERDVVAIAVGLDEGAAVVAGGADAALAASESFKSALARVEDDGSAAVLFLDARAMLRMIDQAAQHEARPEEFERYTKVRDALGLDGLGPIVMRSGFEDAHWVTRAFVSAPAPRRGVLTLFDAGPMDPAALRAVPVTATWLSAFRLDLGRVIDETRVAVAQIDQNMGAAFDQGLLTGSAIVGVDLENQLLCSFGPDWILYSDPASAGAGSVSFALVNRLKDAAKADGALTALEMVLNQQLASMGDDSPFKNGVQQMQIAGVTVHSLPLFIVSPSWAVHEGHLLVGLFPQTVTMAAEYVTGQQRSILDNADFQAMMKRLGGREATAVSFVDLPRTAPQAYNTLLMYSQMLATVAAAEPEGAPTAEAARKLMTLMPPLSKLMPHLSPVGQVAWVDDTGYHVLGISPFPGSTLLAPNANIGGPGTSAMMLGTLLPALGAARRTANQTKSMTNIRQILMGAMVYAADHRGNYPPDLGALVSDGYLDSLDVFVSPTSGPAVPPHLRNAPPEEKARWVNENSTYIYIGAGLNTEKIEDPARRVIVFEDPDRHDGTLALGFADGHAERMDYFAAVDLIEEARGRGDGEGQQPRTPPAPF